MFPSEVYIERRKKLRAGISGGIILFLGNQEVSFNYPSNTYPFRQDSNFSYFFGLDHPDLVGIIDLDLDKDWIFGNDIDIDDIIWMGKLPSIKEQADLVGVTDSGSLNELTELILTARNKGRTIHFAPPYRGETILWLSDLLGVPHLELRQHVSKLLIKNIIKLRMKKDAREIAEIEKMVDVAYLMHTTAMKMAKPGIIEQEIAGTIEGIALSHGCSVSFPVILSINGQTLHNHYHGNTLTKGRMLVIDAGCENNLHYSSDITRSVPVGGTFNLRQKGIYEIVLNANLVAIKAMNPGIPFREIHMLAATEIAKGLTNLGIMKGDPVEAASRGAHTLFFPHGLGHPLGLDVHDLEGMGENLVGYDEEVRRSKEFGLAFLRFGRKLEEGFVMTIEPGIYFIPELIDIWKAENRLAEFINFDVVETYKDFGGIRIEDDVLVTANGYRVLGKPIPKTVTEIEEMVRW
ncbi:MAG: aminopeptidase P family protein [Bacteroidales bacterium]|jgi:Xaa-Pro aminopeptidase|nr:aminopeptidase P family protein [Bacteroidales bacterium]